MAALNPKAVLLPTEVIACTIDSPHSDSSQGNRSLTAQLALDWSAVGAILGGSGLVGALTGWGAMRAQVKRLQQDVSRIDTDVNDLKKVASHVAVVEERTETIRNRVEAIDGKMDRQIGMQMDETRSFMREIAAAVRGPVPSKA